MITPLDAALSAAKAGISVLPPRQDGTKAPDSPSWSHHQRERADPDQIRRWYESGRTGVGWVTGRVSGGLEVIDFDDRSAFAEYKKLVKDAGLGELFDLVAGGYLEHSPNGAHLVYRCEDIAGNTKLAKKGKKTLIETRGEGGFIIVAPTHGSVNQSGSYELVSGGVANIVTITPGQRNNLHDVARMLDESLVPTDSRRHSALADDRPGDDFNRRVSWSGVLEAHGWVKVGERLDVVSWRRPGKDHGISATTNHGGSDLLYVFSTNTEFESERGYSKFSAYGILTHGGDYEEASRQLSLQGYGTRVEVPDEDDEVDLSFLLSSARPHTPSTMAELLRVPGLVGALTRWITDSAVKQQPILALGASICAVATALGNKVRTPTGLRPNVYVLGVGETGCGKERARQAISRLFLELGLDHQLGDSFASDSAVETAIAAHPTSLYMIDEIGQFLGLVKGDQAPAYLKGIMTVFLKMYSSSEGIYRRRTYVDEEKNKDSSIENPCLSIYGTTVPGNLFGNLRKENLSDGLLSRFLVFESDDPDPHVNRPSEDDRRVPDRVLEDFSAWASLKSDDLRPEAMEVPITPAAWEVFDGLELRMRDKRRVVRSQGGDHGPWTRVWATAQKLALIRACGISTTPEVTEADAQWGADLAQYLTERFLERIDANLAENRTEANVLRVVDVIKRSGGSVTKNKITRATQGMSRRERSDAIETAIESGFIAAEEVQSGGRPKMLFVMRK